ncbi:DUF3604 domain-containing protein [Oceanomicrobium pacificus]|uniref:DUF3604 domain-containing protein n=1 Tax=Oceanomicrobium pacificus TaxID=2692916 RepID=A0A6B0TYF2_9RHOB|nr:DUF3604 domain-containing protein [Oceanomicrobium pacificus]MXU66033.1 DUF3604 domain-containing protein [Oceanomicrobium pacificus]
MRQFKRQKGARIRLASGAATFLALVAATPSLAFDASVRGAAEAGAEVYSPFVGRAYPDQLLFGDLHFHTEISFDAGLIGTSLDMHDAFRVARGEKIISNTGQPIQLIRPLDFLAITEHAEMLGLATAMRTSDPRLLSHDWGSRTYALFNSGQEGRMAAFADIIDVGTVQGRDPLDGVDLDGDIWRDIVHTVDDYNDPGRFTALAGFEWTFTPQGDNLHRVILFADGAEHTSQTRPFTFFEGSDPELLWDYLARYEADTGGRAIAVPHNANTSNGLMFAPQKFDGSPMDAEYAAKRIRWEPMHEMTQIKGDEETHPLLSPDDEFADFETWDVSNIAGSAPKTPEMLEFEYARSALKVGLRVEREIGVNPFKFGFYGATDTHTAIPTTREDNYFGKYQHTEPSPNRHNGEVIPADDPALRILTAQESAAGLTAVWARENTREEVFGAITRKEAYATTGSRISVRVFAGWDFEADDLGAPDFVARGYRGGVPMGGELMAGVEGDAPRFMVRALRDPDGANLDRVQLIKGWIDADGKTHERIYDIAVSDEREIGADGRAREPVGNTVDIETATYSNTIGAPALDGFWQDPDYDPAETAFYYVRVIEIPKPRWTTHDAAFYDVPLPDVVPPTVQDRAYTSPIWVTPAG